MSVNPFDQFDNEKEQPNPFDQFDDGGDIGGFKASVKSMAGQTIKGAGRVASDYLGADKDNAVTKYGQSIIDANPLGVSELSDIPKKPWQALKEAAGNAVPSMGGMIGVRAAGQGITALSPLAGPAAPVVAGVGQAVSWLGPLAIAALPSYSGIRDKQILNDPANEESAKAKAIASLGAGTVGWIEQKFGPQSWAMAAFTKEGRDALAKKLATNTLAGSVAKGVGVGALEEGAEEIVQNPVEQLASFDDPTTRENVKDTLFGGVMGALGGGVFGGTAGVYGHYAKPAELAPIIPTAEQPPVKNDETVTPDQAHADIERAFRGWAHSAPVQEDQDTVAWGQQIAAARKYNQDRNTPTVTAEQDPVVGEIERALSPGIKAPERLPKIPPVISAPAIRSNTYGYPLSQEDEATVSDVRQSAIGERVIQGTLPDGRTAYRILDDKKQPLSPWKTFESADDGRTEIQGDTQPDRLDDGGDEGVLRGNRPGPTEEAGTVRENTIGGVASAQQPAGNLNPAPTVADRGEQGVRVGDVAGSGASGQTGASSTVVTQEAEPDLLTRARQHVAETGDTSTGGMMKALDVDIDTAADLVEMVKSEQPAAPSVPRNIAATSPATIANDPQAFLDERKQNLTERAEFASPVRNPGESARDFLARRKGWLNSGKVEEVSPSVAIKSVGTRPPLQSDDAIGLQGEVTEAKQDIVTDPAQVQEIKNSIVEGESILNTGEFNGKKRGVPYLNGVRKSVLSAKAKIGDTSETPEVGAHKKQQPTTPLDRTMENPGGMASSGTLRPQQPTAGSTKTGRQAKPRLAESGDDLWRKFVSTSNTGIVDKYDGILYPVAKIVGDDTEYSYHNGEVFKVSGRIGDKLVKASEREQGELHNAFTSDSVEVYSKTRWGGSGNEDIRTAKRRTTLHSPSGNSFKPQQPKPEADNGLRGQEEEVVQPPEAFNANEQVAEVNRVNPARNVNDQGEQARRGKPKNTVEFSTPIKGSKGGEIQTYRWAWKYEMQEGRDGDVEEVRASDWDNAIDNPETGRKIVHHFDIVTPEGESKTVSLESAKEILGIEGNLLTKVRQERNRQFLDEIARNRRLFRDKYTKTTYSNSGYHKTENKIYAKGYGEARAIYDEIGRLAGNKLRNPTDRAVSLLMNKHGNRLRELNEQLAPYVSDVSQPPSPQVKATPATLTKPVPKESPAPVAETPKRDGKAAAKLEDFGEKIGAARKDLWSSFKDKLADVKDADIASQPLSKIWPLPDYKAMIDGGADGLTVSIVRALRDSIPAKPKRSWRLAGWAEVAGAMRKVAVSLLDGSASIDKAISTIQGLSVTGLKDQIDLYQVVGHEKSLAGVRIAVGKYSMLDGIEYKPRKTVWSVEQEAKKTALSNWPRMMATGDTREEAIANFAKKYSELDINKPAEKQVDFVIYSTQGVDGFFVGKKIGRNYADLAGPFKTVKEARAHKTEKHDELLAKLEKYKEIPSERRDTNEPRAGVDMRGGQDVTPEMFQEAFGFRGVEFGNWVEGSRRQEDLNNAYDALMDMAAVIGIPPRAISLNGELGLAFGARGSGGINPAIAHYESTHVVINLTKKKGAGSLGHEWWHALDNYFSRMRGEKSSHMTDSLDVTLVSKDSNYIHKGAVRKAMVDAFGGVMRVVRKTAIKARSAKLDQRRSKDYWTTKPEMSARAFESYLISKLHDQNASNDYLANIVAPETWKAAEALGFELDDSYPYPTAGELPVIRAAFDHLFNTIEAKPTDKGVALMSETSQPIPPPQRADIAAELTSAFGRLRARLLLKRIQIVPTQEEARRIIKGIEAKLSAAFHGSPHDFERFKMEAIGTGEGAQAYGYGLYFASRKEVAEYYKDSLSSDDRLLVDGKKLRFSSIPSEAWGYGKIMEVTGRSFDDIYAEVLGRYKTTEKWVEKYKGTSVESSAIARHQRSIDDLKRIEYYKGKNIEIGPKTQGRIYEVELAPDEQDYLLYDSPLSDLAGGAKTSLFKSGPNGITRTANFLGDLSKSKSFMSEGYGSLDIPTQRLVLENMLAAAQDAEVLNSIVRLIPVDVMDILIREKLSPDVLFHDKAMLHNLLLSLSDKDIPSGAYSPSSSLINITAISAAKGLPESFVDSFSEKALSAGETDDIWHKNLLDLSQYINTIRSEKQGVTGEVFYKRIANILGSQRAASEYLHSLGIRGIKYLDGSSRGKGDGAYNYVIFNENDVEIKVKYSESGAIQGFYDGASGQVYIVQDGLAKDKTVGVILHEFGEHAAKLGFASDPEYQSILQSLERLQSEQSKRGEAIRAAIARVPENTRPEHKWSEVAAYLVENNADSKLGIVGRIINFFKRWLFKAGRISADKFSVADIVQFARAATLAHTGATYTDGVKRSVSSMFKPVDVESAAFKRWFAGSKVVDKDGNPLNVNGLYVNSKKSPPKKPRGYKTGKALRNKIIETGRDVDSMSSIDMINAGWEVSPDTMQGWYQFTNRFSDPEQAGETEFFLHGLYGLEEPKLVIGRRRGDIDFLRVSRNHASGEYEHGVSVINVLTPENQMDETRYDMSLSDKNNVWIWGYALDNNEFYGADGEVLLANAEVLSKANTPVVKSAISNTGDFSPTDPRIRFSRALPQTATEAFKRWFGNSKITKNGKPQVLYHGTTHPRFLKDGEYPWIFDQNRPRNPANSNLSGLGIFLGGMNDAEAHAGYKGTVHPFYVRMEKPYVTTAAELEKKVDASGAEAFRKRLQELSGHDGIIIKDRGHAIVFGASQVKSATNNTGAFSEDKDVRYSTATVAQENLAEDYGTISERVAEKVDLKPWERIIATAEYTLVKTPAGQRMISAAERRMMNKFQYENWILDGTMTTEMWEARQAQLPEDQRTPYAVHYQETHGGFLNTIKALAEDAKATFGEYLRNIDRTGKAFRLKNVNGWEVKDPTGKVIGLVDTVEEYYELRREHHGVTYGKNSDTHMKDYTRDKVNRWEVIDPKNKTVSFHENEVEAVTAMMDAEESAMQSKGIAADVIKAVRMFREMTNRAFDMQVSDLRKIISDREELGLPPLEMSIVDESKRWAIKDRHGKVLTTYETKEQAEEQLHELSKYKPGFANAKITRQSDTDITGKVTIQDYIALIGDLRGSYFPRQRQSGGVIMTAVNEKTGDRILEKFDLYVTKGKKIDPNTGAEMDEGKIAGLMRKSFNRFSPLGRRAEALRKQGYNVSITKDQSMPESVFAAAQLSSSISAMLDESLARVEKGSNSPAMQSAYAEIHKTVVAGIADMFKQRGALSSRIKRAEEYYRGFEEDPVKAAVQYAKSMAGGIAKRQAAQEITLAMTGRDVSWQKFREDNPDGTWEEYSELVEQRKIDPKKQKNMYTEGMSWTEEVLRNDEQSDRIIGTLKGIAVLKYLGFRVSSAAVNMTNLVQAVPATISSVSGGTIHGAMGEVTRSLKALALFSRGNANELDKRIFSEISERGWDSAQFNHDAAAVMRSKAGNAWGKFSDAAMWMFGKAEKVNRATTIHAAYMQLQKQSPSYSHAELMDKAKHISDRAHGVYGKETAPVWTRGASNPLRMTWTFMKFSQNYMLNMGEMIGRGDYKNAAYMLLSPAILGGAGASLATPVLVALASSLGIGGDDPEEELYAWAEKQFGSDKILRHGLPGMLGINFKGSLQVNNPLPTTLEELFGAPGSILFDMRDAARDVKRGAYSKAVEKALPTAFVSPLKAYREYNEGMTTGTGTPIFYGDKPLKATEWDAAVRAFSFNPSRLSGIREKQWSETVVAKRYQDEKKDINAKIKKAFIKGNGRIDQRYWIDLAAEIEHYNERVKGVNLGDVTPITKKSIKLLRRNVTRPNKRERERK